MADGSVRVKINPKNFDRGVKSARRLHGTYDPQSKTWLIPAQMAEFIGPQNPGLIVVTEAPKTCPFYVLDQGCPLHGETCPGRR